MHTHKALIAGLSLCLACRAVAADDSKDERIEALEAEVAELRSLVTELKAGQGESWLTEQRADEIKSLVQDVLADADTRASLLQDGATAGWDKGFFLRSADGNWSLRMKGQLDLRYTWNSAADQGTLAPPEQDNLYGFEVRRAKLMWSGNVFDPSWEYEVKAGFSSTGGVFILENAWIQKSFENGLAIRAGQFKLPFLLEETDSSTRQLLVDRSYVNELYNQDYSKGIQGNYSVGAFQLWAAYSDGFASRNTPFSAATANCVTARAEWKVLGDWKQFGDMTSFRGSENALMLGAAFNWQTSKYGAKTDRYSWTIDASWKSNGWNVFAYVTGNHVNPPVGSTADQFGFVVQGGYFLCDTWEVFGRYEWSDLDGLSPTGVALPTTNHVVSIITTGVNYYIDKHNLKWQTDIGIGLAPVPLDQTGIGWRQDAVGTDGQIVLRTQFQLLF